MTKLLFLLTFLTVSLQSFGAGQFFSESVLQLDNRFSHHTLVVEKSTHTLFLYKNNSSGNPQLVKTYSVATGKITGDKAVQGDKKTPEGVYTFQKFHSSQELIHKYGDYGKIYGAGAFTTNYPNIIDRRKGKTGGGIWLHSTDDDKRVSKGLDSKGCVVAMDSDLKEISQYLDLANTPVVIVQNHRFLAKKAWKTKKTAIMNTINTWMTSWQNKDFKSYINSYSKKEFNSPRGKFKAYKAYKRAVFARTDKPEIKFKHLSVLSAGDYIVATMEQTYFSAIIKDTGKKVLYLKQNDRYKWEIVYEGWTRIDKNNEVAFTPMMRFFNNQKQDVENDS